METNELALFNQTVVYDENNSIFIQPLCDFFGINITNQLRFIKKDVILKTDLTKKSSHYTKKYNNLLFKFIKKG
jgi:hypothetical protein